MIIYAKLQCSHVRHLFGIFGGKSQTSFSRNATRTRSEEGRLFSQANGLLACMFGPKIYVIMRQPDKNTHEAVSSQVSDYSFKISPKGRKGISPEKASNQEQMHLEFASVSSLTN